MPIIAKGGENKVFHLVPAGTYQAVCSNVWDIGLQEKEFKGKKVVQHKCIILWELNETIESDDEYSGKRFTISKKYTLSLNAKATLHKDLLAWRGRAFSTEEIKGFDLEKLIGVNAMLSIIHNEVGDKTYANVSAVMKLAKGMMPVKPENPRTVPTWVQKFIDNQASEPVETDSGAETGEDAGEDEQIPF